MRCAPVRCLVRCALHRTGTSKIEFSLHRHRTSTGKIKNPAHQHRTSTDIRVIIDKQFLKNRKKSGKLRVVVKLRAVKLRGEDCIII